MTVHQELKITLDRLDLAVEQYRTLATQAADAEATHKSARAKRMLAARADGVRSVSEAEAIAEADDNVGDLYRARLTTAAVADATKQSIVSLRERVGALRSVIADQRVADQLHASTGVTP